MGFNGVIERLVAGKWIAGEHINDAIRVSKRFNKNNIVTIINYLGERLNERSTVENSVEIYLKLIDAITTHGVAAEISVKATQLGLLLGKNEFEKNYRKIIRHAHRKMVFVWLDMEEYEFVTDTIAVYEKHIGETGICVQSYLKRSYNDVKKLAKRNATIRLVKGAYGLPGSVAYKDREKTTLNYVKIVDFMYEHCKKFTVGTHDSKIIENALRLNKKYKRDVTYAMLNGIRNRYATELANSGEKVSIYVPFGEEWIGYSYRRLKELSHLKLIIRSLFGG